MQLIPKRITDAGSRPGHWGDSDGFDKQRLDKAVIDSNPATVIMSGF